MGHARATSALPVVALLAAALTASPARAEPPGDAARGSRVFASKQCASCHRPSGQPGVGPALERLRHPQGAYELAGRLWNHAPAMFTGLTQERLEWPRITDLAEARERYAPAATWAAAVWRHTPRMAAVAIQREVLYPRFSGDEMVDLLGFLRSGTGTP